MVTSEKYVDLAHVDEILNKHPKEQRFTLAILQDIQKEYRYIPREALNKVSDYLSIPLSKLYGMATFYKALSLVPKGENIITVCDGTACHVRGSVGVLEQIQNYLHIMPGETTENGKFSLQTVNCLGSCAIAPVMVINDKYYGKVTPNMIKDIINQYGGDEIHE
ncbi:MAG: NADH-quinone oxidoreductase subunit NuoE [Clostridium sp.]|nr:NADH-quinone oxidoreductase subunit NuoE [Clostridium sp.]